MGVLIFTEDDLGVRHSPRTPSQEMQTWVVYDDGGEISRVYYDPADGCGVTISMIRSCLTVRQAQVVRAVLGSAIEAACWDEARVEPVEPMPLPGRMLTPDGALVAIRPQPQS